MLTTVNDLTPACSTSSADDVSEPGSGDVSDLRTVDECSRSSPSSTVRAVDATSNPALARWTGDGLTYAPARSGYQCGRHAGEPTISGGRRVPMHTETLIVGLSSPIAPRPSNDR
jgi:hypothetical protein